MARDLAQEVSKSLTIYLRDLELYPEGIGKSLKFCLFCFICFFFFFVNQGSNINPIYFLFVREISMISDRVVKVLEMFWLVTRTRRW